MYHYRPVVLIIFDGWGVAPPSDGNAISRAKLPHWRGYLGEYPALTLHAAGPEVGLLRGEVGNSEVGHLNIGAGRVYYQSAPRLNQEIAAGSWFTNPAFAEALAHVKQRQSTLHLIGLVSAGNVHASLEHLYALLELCRRERLDQTAVAVHAILDGRDCGYNAGAKLIAALETKLRTLKVGRIATLSGRFYAMDRDNRWERVAEAYQAMAEGKSQRTAGSAAEAMAVSYAAQNFDEEFIPTVLLKKGKPVALVASGDAVIFFNFRPDRARQLTKAFVLPGFDKFPRLYRRDLFFVTMLEYEKDLPVRVAFAPVVVRQSLAEVISAAGLNQFHLAETEKYAHVTFFLNGTIEKPFPGEERFLAPSPKVGNYATIPEMSARELTRATVKALSRKQYDFIVINFANPDMVAHTGDLAATIAAVEAVDRGLGEIVEHVLALGGVAVVTADHGNAEEVINLKTGAIDKEHSTNPVPVLIIGQEFRGQAGPAGDAPEGDLSLLPPVGVLSDVAPTVLKLMGLDQPPEMTGTPLI